MTEESKVRDVVDAVTGVAKAIPIYQDALQPAAQEVGKALQTIAKTVHVALAPVSALVWGYDQVKEFVSTKVADRLKNVPPENIITPKPNIAGPTLEALKYVGHESTLSDLYANLLAASMDKSTSEGVHPAFVDVIKYLTPDEAKLLKLFIGDRTLPLINLGWAFNPNAEGRSGGMTILTSYSHLGIEAGCELQDMMPTYIDNLCRLGLANIPTMSEYTVKGVYDALEQDPKIKTVLDRIDKMENVHYVIDRRYLQVTQFGKKFANICTVNKT